MNPEVEQSELRRLMTARLRLRERLACLREFGYESSVDDDRSSLDSLDRAIQALKRKIRETP